MRGFIRSLILTVTVMLVSAAPALAETSILFSLDWIVGGRHAPWLLALEKGYYRDEGLDVKISRGFGFKGGIQRIMSGEAQFNFNDIPSLVIARANQDVKIMAVATIYAKTPVAVFSLKKTGITGPQDLKGKTIATDPGGVSRMLFPGFARVNGLDPESVHWVASRGAQKLPLLLGGKVDAITNYIMERPNLERKSADLGGINMFLYADHGISMLSNGILVADDYAAKNPEIVRGFVRASLRGFKYSFEHPAEAVKALLKREPTLDPEIAEAELAMVKILVMTDAARKLGLGYADTATIQSTIDTVAKYYKLNRVPTTKELYSSQYIK